MSAQYFNSLDLVLDQTMPAVDAGQEIFNIRCDPQHVKDYLNITVENPQFVGEFKDNKYGKSEVPMIVSAGLEVEIDEVCEKVRQHVSKKWKLGRRVDFKNPIFRQRITVKCSPKGVDVEQNDRFQKMTCEQVNEILNPQGRVPSNIQQANIVVRFWGKMVEGGQDEEQAGIKFGVYFTLDSIRLLSD